MRGGLGQRGGVEVGQEIGQHLHRLAQAEFAVLRAAEFAFRHDQVHVVQLPVQIAGIAPELRRTAVIQHAAQALARIAQLAVVAPEHMGRADQPMLVRLVDLQARAQRQHARPAHQRDVVVPDDVVMPVLHDLRDPAAVDQVAPGLLRHEVGQHPVPAAQPDGAHAVILGRPGRHAAQRQVRVLVMHHGHVMAARGQRPRHPLHAHRVAAKGIGRVEGGEHQDAQRSHAGALPLGRSARSKA